MSNEVSTRKRLTRRQKQAYLKDGGGHCPYCGSGEIQGDTFDYEAGVVSQRVTCLNPDCGRQWYDEYRLARVVEE